MKTPVIIFSIILLLLAGCRKPIDSASELVGKWYSCEGAYGKWCINIDENGKGIYASGINAWYAIPNQTVKADENSFRIGNTRFDIDVHPIPFDSATDWVDCVRTSFAPGHLPTMKMKLSRKNTARWFYKRRN